MGWGDFWSDVEDSVKEYAPIIGAAAGFSVAGPVGAAVGLGIGGGIAAGEAADAQSDAANAASATQWRMYEQSRADQAPWLKAGEGGLNELAGMLRIPGYKVSTDWQKDPGYEFQRDEGQKAIDRSYAARGNLLSGAALKAASRYNQDYASGAYNQRLNRLASIAGVGQTAAGTNSANAMQTGRDVAENQIGAGNARASGYMGMSNALTGAVGTGINLYQGNQLMNYLKGAGQQQMVAPMTAPNVTWAGK